MKKIAVALAATGLMALAACGGTPANESVDATNNAVEPIVLDEALNAAEANAVEPVNAVNAANAI